MAVSAAVDIPRPLVLVQVAPVVSVVALAAAMASVVVSREAVAVAVSVGLAVVVTVVAASGTEVASTEEAVSAAAAAVVVVVIVDLASKTASALLLTHLQVLALAAAVIETGTAMAPAGVVGMTVVVVVAHMKTGRDVMAADSAAIVTDAGVEPMPTTNLSEATEEVATLTNPGTMTDSIAGNVGLKEDMKTLASCVATSWVSWWWVSSVFKILTSTLSSFLLPLATKGKQG